MRKIVLLGFCFMVCTAGILSAQDQNGSPDSTSTKETASSSAPNLHPARIRVGGAVMAQKLVHQVLPDYPGAAKKKHLAGSVLLRVVVSRDGSVETVDFISGLDELKDASMRAVKKWRYRPTLLNGQPVEVETKVEVVFSL